MIFSHWEFGFHWVLSIPTFVILASERDLLSAQFGSGGLVRAGYLIFIDKVHLQGVHPESSQ